MIQIEKVAERIGYNLEQSLLVNVERLTGAKEALLLYGLGAYHHYIPQRKHQFHLHYVARTEALYEWLRLRFGADEDVGGYFRFTKKGKLGRVQTYRIYRPDRYIGHRAPEYSQSTGTPIVDLDSLIESVKQNTKRPPVIGAAALRDLVILQEQRRRHV